jgi:hypothetical protein
VNDAPRVSIVVETSNWTLSRRMDIAEGIERAEEAAREAGLSFEIIAPNGDRFREALPESVRTVATGPGYYEQKNGAVAIARGESIAFFDSDCRARRGYLRAAADYLDAHPNVSALAGVSWYTGSSLLSRINTVFSFGHLHDPDCAISPRSVPMAHNLVLRRSHFDDKPFGPITGRHGGDAWLTRKAQRDGKLIARHPALVMEHESYMDSIFTFLDRHLSEMFHRTEPVRDSGARVLAEVCTMLVLAPFRRVRHLVRYGRHCGMRLLDFVPAFGVIAVYEVVDAIVGLPVAVVPAWRQRWLDRHFGPRA